MDVTLSGMVIEMRDVQSAKAQLPMLVTLSGMVTEVSELQPKQALSARMVTGQPFNTAGMGR